MQPTMKRKFSMFAHQLSRYIRGKGWGFVPVSVIIPVYNVEAYVKECLDSVINQTLTDIEIICVDDGSTDHSGRILDTYAKHDSRIHVIHKANGGVASARNAGMRYAHGEMLMFLDADDFLELNTCERVWQEMCDYEADMVIYGGTPYPSSENAPRWMMNNFATRDIRYDSFNPYILFYEHGTRPFVWHHGYRRSVLEEHDMWFDERVPFGEDNVFQVEVTPHCQRFAFISDKLHHYRWIREGSLMDQMSKDLLKKKYHHTAYCHILTEYWQKQGWLEKYGFDFTRWIMNFQVKAFLDMDKTAVAPLMEQTCAMLEKYELLPYLDQLHVSYAPLIKAVEECLSNQRENHSS